MDVFDKLSSFASEYINKKISNKVGDIEKALNKKYYSIKIDILRTLVFSLFLLTGLLALVTGIILLLSKYFPLEYILIFYGIITVLAVLLGLTLNRNI